MEIGLTSYLEVMTAVYEEGKYPIVHGIINVVTEKDDKIKTILEFNVLATEKQLEEKTKINKCKNKIIETLIPVFKKLYIKYNKNEKEVLCIEFSPKKKILVPIVDFKKEKKKVEKTFKDAIKRL